MSGLRLDVQTEDGSPSMRREWIEIDIGKHLFYASIGVSLHAEGVD